MKTSSTSNFSLNRRVRIFLNTSDIEDGKILHNEYSNKEGLPGQAKKSIQKGDILFTEIRPANKRYALIDFDAEGAVNLGNDISFCDGNTLTLNAKSGYISYKWSDGSTDSTLQINTAGTYGITVLDACGAVFTDAVTVTKESIPPLVVGSDRTICNNDTLHLNAPGGFISYSWSPNYNISSSSAQSVIAYPTADTSYFIRAEKKKGCFVYDTVSITVMRSPSITLGNDTSICSGTSIVVDVGNNFQSYSWNTGATTSRISVSSPGRYFVTTVYSNGCVSRDTINVTLLPNPVIDLGTDTTLCTNGSRTLSVGAVYKNYLWHDGSVNSSFMVNSLGTYSVNVVDYNGCVGGDTITIGRLRPVLANFLPPDTSICSYGTLDLKPTGRFQSYLWSNNSTSPGIQITKPGTYALEVTDRNNCIGRDSITVSFNNCIEGVYFPTAFTPNNDGKNDLFKPIAYTALIKYYFAVYDRLGQKLFEATDPAKGWDGKIKSQMQNTGTYVWHCVYQIAGDNERQEKGTVVLIR